MLGGSTLGVGVTLFLRDQFSGPASRIRNSANAMQNDMNRMREAQLRQQRNMYAGLAMAGGLALRGMGRMVKKSAEFGYEMKFVKTITQATIEEQLRLNKVAKHLGRETMFYPQAIAEGMRFMAMAGMSAKEVRQNIQGAVSLAGATKSELGGKGGAADIMTNVMKQFAIGFEYTNDVANRLSYGVTRANTNLFDMGEALKYAGSTAMDLNMGLDESIAMVMALGNAGMQGSMAGVAMENSMRYLTRALSKFGSGTSKKALAEIGLTTADLSDANGNLVSMTEAIQRIGGALGGLGNIAKQSVLQNLFGVRGKRAGSLFIRNLKEFKSFTGDVANVQPDYANKVLADMMSTLKGQMMRLGSTWDAMWISFTEKIEPTLIIILKALTKTLGLITKVFDKKIIGGFLATGIAGFITIKTVAFAYRSVQAGIRLLTLQSGMAATTMATQTVAGYGAMTVAARRYNATMMASGVGQFARRPVNIMGAARSGRISGVRVNKAGRMISSKTGRFVSKKAAAYGGARVAAGAGARVAAGMGVKSLLGRIVGILGGPWGMALSFILPGLLGGVIDAVRGSKKSTEDNTRQLEAKHRKDIASSVEYSRIGHMIKLQDLKSPELTTIASTATGQVKSERDTQTLNKLSEKLEKMLAIQKEIPINIYIDGEKADEIRFERNMADALNIGM